MITASMHEAKTQLSELVRKAQLGETVIITSGRDKTPVARIEPIEPFVPKRLGVLYTPGFEIPDSFYEPLSDEECGYGDDGNVL